MEARDYLHFSLNRASKVLYINFLEYLEDIKQQHDNSFFKLMEGLPEQYKAQVIQASFMDQAAFEHFRKRVLDHGNVLVRTIDEEMKKFDIDFKR